MPTHPRQQLNISPALPLPFDIVTSTIIIYGGKGMGKTNLGAVFAEELYAAGLRFSVIDPMGVWWGLQHGVNRKSQGLGVLILGGRHGDLPIEPTAGAVVADLVVDESVSVVIDISRRADGTSWSVGEKIRFVGDYMTRLYERQGERMIPIMQIIDEAARFIPQQVPHGAINVAFCTGAISQVVEEGRNFGIGVTLITQRSARMNKSVSELADIMIAFRTIGPNSTAAILEWFGEHVDKSRHKDLLEQLRKLPIGTALVVSPGLLGFEGVAALRARQTFDSSATPKVGQQLQAPGKAAKPDLDKYTERMAATIEQAKANDPRELRRVITRLQGELNAANARTPQPAPAPPAETITVHIITDQQLDELARAWSAMKEIALQLSALPILEAAKEVGDAAHAIDQAVRSHIVGQLPASTKSHHPAPRPAPTAPLPQAPSNLNGGSESKNISASQQAILDAIAWFEAAGIPTPHRFQVAFMAQASPNSSTYGNNTGALRTAGLVDYPGPSLLCLTSAGHARANAPSGPITVAEFRKQIFAMLSASKVAILKVLIEIYPQEIEREELARRVGASAASSTFGNNTGALRTLGLVEYPGPARVVALPILFLK